MFRKFADRLSAGVAAVTGSSDNNDHQQKVQQLTAMGFDRTQAEQALQATNGNVDQAAELLLASSTADQQAMQTARHVPKQHNKSRQEQEDEDLQRAMEASLQTNNHNNNQTAAAAPRQTRTAAMEKAAQAAEARNQPNNNKKKKNKATTTTAATRRHYTTPNSNNNNVRLSTASAALAVNHPGVKVVPKLQDKTIEEQLLRCADRLKSKPHAVDTLYKACKTIQQHPSELKYRTIDTTTVMFQRSLASAPGAVDFLKALHFQEYANGTKLVLHDVDPARLYLGVSALEQVKETPEYIGAKQRLQLTRELEQLQQKANNDTAEAVQRAQFLAQCPSEPPEGRGALVYVALADHATIQRRFDADDTLQDVLYWLAASLGQAILDKLVVTREWMLRDAHRKLDQPPLDCTEHAPLTLQYLGCWPSGRLEVAVSSEAWKMGNDVGNVRGSARGLGAAPKEAL